MKIVVKIGLTLLLTALLLFSVFGFLCTFEPLPSVTQWTWRLIYGIVALLAILGSVRLWKSKSSSTS